MFIKRGTVIAAATAVQGSLECGADDAHVHGRLVGSVVSSATVTITEEGRVEGDVNAKFVVVGGVVEGTVTAHERLHMLSTGRVLGDAKYGTLQVDRGGVVKGRTMTMTDLPPDDDGGSGADDTLEFAPPALAAADANRCDRITADYTDAVAAARASVAADTPSDEAEGEDGPDDGGPSA
jgi:cytoskeletal protein CcmA (bactofilin family)